MQDRPLGNGVAVGRVAGGVARLGALEKCFEVLICGNIAERHKSRPSFLKLLQESALNQMEIRTGARYSAAQFCSVKTFDVWMMNFRA